MIGQVLIAIGGCNLRGQHYGSHTPARLGVNQVTEMPSY
jgi:hypothetical protein